jgi:hypothetical protein
MPGLLCLLVLSASEGADRRAQAQGGKPSRLSLFLTFKKDGVAPSPKALELRPNVLQEVFAYVKNDGEESQSVTVQLVASDGKVEATSKPVTAAGGKATLVEWAPAPSAPPGKPPAPQELPMPVVLRMTDKSGPVGRDLPVVIASAADYLRPPAAEFFPASAKQGQAGNRFEVEVKRNKDFPFGGPASRVELDLRPDRIKGLVPGQEKKGRYSGLLGADTDSLVLEARDLQLEGNARGFVYLNVDGVPRAFVFGADFPVSGKPTTSLLATSPILATSLPRYARPSAAMPLIVETGGARISENARIKLDLLASSKDGKDEYAEVAEFKGPRQEKLFFGKTGPNGGLLFQPEVKDWSATVDLSGVLGTTKVRLRLFNQDGKEQEVINGAKPPSPDGGETTREMVQEITIDATPPVVKDLGTVPSPVARGRKLLVKARCADDESTVTEVVFYLGKPGPDGKMAPDAPQARARLEKDDWQAEFDVPADQKSPLGVVVRVTNGVGMQTTKSLSVEVVDPEPDYGSIVGRVYEKEAPVDNVRVRLYDAKGILRRRERSAEGGKFAFKDLYDGKYRVAARHETTNYAAEKVVTVQDKKVIVEGKPLTEPLELVLQPPPPGADPKKARISGVVREGDRTQRGLTVTLSDAASGKALLTTKTGEAGQYEFKDLKPGKYRVSASKSASNTRGQQTVDLKEAEDKTGVDIKLYR